MKKKFKILDYSATISGIDGHKFLMFGRYHQEICIELASRFNIPINGNCINWNCLLKKLYPTHKINNKNFQICISPEFENDKQVEYFALSLQTEFLINII